MNNPLITEEGFPLEIKPRPSTTMTISVPVDVLASLTKVALHRDMSVEALVKLYVGQILRQDLSQLFADRVLETTAQVLARHIQSETEISEIMKEILAGCGG